MRPLSELATRLKKLCPAASIDFSEPASPNGVGFLDVTFRGNVIEVQWKEGWNFGVSSPEGHCYGEKADEVYVPVDQTATRIAYLLNTGART